MSFIFRVVRIFYIFIVLFPLAGNAVEDQVIDNGRIHIKSIIDYSELLRIIEEEEKKDVNQTFFVITDWDETVVGISNFDFIHRQHNTSSVIGTLKKKSIPVCVATARWLHQSIDLNDYKKYATSMEQGTGIYVSDQKCFDKKTIDFRKLLPSKRGVFMNGICFTGSSKGQVTNALLDHPDLPKASHYLFVDDDEKYISQMIEVFKNRKEKATILHYPNELEIQKHTPLLKQISLENSDEVLLSHLHFLLRHNYEYKVLELLQNTRILEGIRKGEAFPFLIDLNYSKNESLAEKVLGILKFDLKKIHIIKEVFLESFDQEETSPFEKWFLKKMDNIFLQTELIEFKK
ncbi:DUF2608 domain-containing protein [Candidatus Bealeia paramacronuclearis]